MQHLIKLIYILLKEFRIKGKASSYIVVCLVGWNHGSFPIQFFVSSFFLCLVERTKKCENEEGIDKELIRNHDSLLFAKNHGSLPIPHSQISKMTKLSLNKSNKFLLNNINIYFLLILLINN